MNILNLPNISILHKFVCEYSKDKNSDMDLSFTFSMNFSYESIDSMFYNMSNSILEYAKAYALAYLKNRYGSSFDGKFYVEVV